MPPRQVDLRSLRGAGQVGDTQENFVIELPDTERFAGRRKVRDPRPKTLLAFLTAMSRLVQLRSDPKLRDCASTFMDSYP
jgi:hypothetical protein